MTRQAPTATPRMDGWFLHRLRQFGDSDAIVLDRTTYSYDDLTALVDDWQRYLDDEEVQAGDVVTLEGEYSPEACAGLLALIARGAIVAPLTAPPESKREEFRDVAQAEVVIKTGEQGGRRCQRTGRHADHVLYDRLRRDATPGLVLFSSGTSGRSKASVLDFDKVLGRYGERKRARRTLFFLALDHIGGINTLLHTLSQGGAVVTVPERSPEAVFAAIAEHQIQVLPTTPTFLNMALISGVCERYDTASLELVTYGTEPMPSQTLQRLNAALPHVHFKQTYGLSELGILPTRSKSDDALWIRLGGGGFEYKIIDGMLWIRSEMAMLGYLNAPDPFDEEGFFNTGDEVETDGDYIRILGRSSEIINVAGEKVYPAEVESVLLEVPNVAEAAVSAQSSPVTGSVVKATLQLTQPEHEKTAQRRAREHCRQRLESFKVPALMQVSDDRQHTDRFKKIRSAA